ncbi:unnamed protein product, partial [Clonostachys chloroleuca]
MADPLNITAAILSTKSLKETVKRYEDGNENLQRLQEELGGLLIVLENLERVSNVEVPILSLLKVPLGRCSQSCRHFENYLQELSGELKAGSPDEVKMRVMSGDIIDFLDLLGGYKSTISVALGSIAIQNSNITSEVLQEHKNWIQKMELDSLIKFTGLIREQLDAFTSDTSLGSDQERLLLETNLEAVMQDLEVCKQASKDTMDSGDSSQLLVNTSANLFTIKGAPSGMRSVQFIGSISDEGVRKMVADRYAHLPGTTTAGETETDHSTSPPEMKKTSEMTDESLQELFRLPTDNIVDGSGEGFSGRLSISETQIRDTTSVLYGLQENRLAIEDDQQKRSATAHNIEDDSADSGVLSNSSSLWDAQSWESSSLTSGPQPEITRLSMQKLADVVLDHTELGRILEASASHSSVQPEIVLDEFKRLIGLYYRDLRRSSNATEYKPVSQLLKRSRGIIINKARKLLGLVYNNLLWDQRAKMTRQAKNEMIYYLWQRMANVPNTQNTALPLKPTADTGSYHNISEESDSDEDSSLEDYSYPEISAAIAFIKDGIPMQKFQAEMHRFVLNAAWE